MIYCFVVCCVNFVSYLIEASVIPQKDFSSQAIQSYQHSCVNKELWQHEDKGEDFFIRCGSHSSPQQDSRNKASLWDSKKWPLLEIERCLQSATFQGKQILVHDYSLNMC